MTFKIGKWKFGPKIWHVSKDKKSRTSLADYRAYQSSNSRSVLDLLANSANRSPIIDRFKPIKYM